MREQRTYGSVRGAISDDRPYRDHEFLYAGKLLDTVNTRNRVATVRELVCAEHKGISDTGD